MADRKTSKQPGATPYSSLPAKAFWRSAVAEAGPLQISGLWSPKWRLRASDRVITAGSCFAQHIGRALKARGYDWYDAEPAPPMLSAESRTRYHYGIFSFRTGNIYTPALLDQWLAYALGDMPPPDEVWEKDGRYYDPLRPQIEPGGFKSVDELTASREATLAAIRHAIETAHVFVFTLGLTEAWRNKTTGLVYASCPGTIAGQFNEAAHEFVNFSYAETLDAMRSAFERAKRINPGLRLLLTVSPVPLTATAAPDTHVLTATTYSKSVLRSVAGRLAERQADIDYFPSYEIITAFPFRGMFFEPNMRSVDPKGVDMVMTHFFADMEAKFGAAAKPAKAKAGKTKAAPPPDEDEGDVVCEDAVLDFYNEN